MAARYRMADPRDAGFAAPVEGKSPTATRRKLSEDEIGLLRACATFRPLEAHAAAYLERRPAPAGGLGRLIHRWLSGGADPPTHSELVTRLEALAREGFLVSDAALAARLRQLAQGSPSGARVTTLGLTTRNRVDCLRRGLLSYIENARQHARPIECLVIDDSPGELVRTANQRMLADLRYRHGGTMRYAAAPERESFVGSLCAESGVEEDVVRFAVFGDPRCPITTGSSRNCLLLDTVGGAYILVDDDCVCRMARTPGAEPGLAFASGNDPAEIWFFADREAMLREVAHEEADFFGVHEELLGSPLGGLIPEAPDFEPLDLNRASPAFYQTLFERGGRVRATVGGVIGDSGIGSTAYLSVNPPSAKRVALSEERYGQFVENRQVFRAATRPTVSEGAFCFAGNLGIDNRELLPPFIPVQRNSDGLFARTLRLCDPASYLAHPAWGCLHDPEKPRKQSMEDYFSDMRRLRFGDVLHLLIGACPAIEPSTPLADALGRLGRYLVELGALPPPEFEAATRSEVARTMQRLAETSPAANSGLPRFYTELQERHRATMREAATQREFVIPRDLDDCADDVTALTQDLVRRFGLVLKAWPAVASAARRLRNAGERLTRDL